jgi:hypothetical protein
MKRLLLPASALVLVVTACGAGAKPAPRVTEARARQPSVHSLVVRRKAAARREATKLLREFVPPPGARSTREPRGYGGIFTQSGPAPLAEVFDAHRFWRVPESLDAVMRFVRAHRPHGLTGWGSSYGQDPRNVSQAFASPGTGAPQPSRILNVTAVAFPGRTVLRVDAKAVWIYPRSPSEKVPAGVTRIVVRAPKVSVKVTDPAKLGRIIRWIDALPVSPPGVVVACPLIIGVDITVSFRSTSGHLLAQARVPPRQADVCDPIGFETGGHVRKPLVDAERGPSFVNRLERLLGVPLLRPIRPRDHSNG